MSRPSIAPRSDESRVRSRSNRNYRLYRKLVLNNFAKLKHGLIHFKDDLGSQTFGTPDSEFEVNVTINDNRFYSTVIFQGSLGAAESYIQGDWECSDLTQLFRIFIKNQSQMNEVERALTSLSSIKEKIANRFARNTIQGSKRNIVAHYDLSNAFYKLWLDPTMTYSSGIFPTPQSSMEEASLEKLNSMCRIVDLQPTDHILEIGTGWGSLSMYAAKHYGCRITTTTISDEQYKLALQRIEEAGLQDQITVVQEDYRKLKGQFDKIISIEMIEAVGHEFIPTYVEALDRLLKPGGKVAIQGITINDQIYDSYRKSIDFIKKYIFPGGNLLSVSYFMDTVGKHSSMRPIHLSEIGMHYATTLQRWRASFNAVLPEVRALGFSEAFIRLWNYYLTYCEAGFQEKHIGNVQMGFEKR